MRVAATPGVGCGHGLLLGGGGGSRKGEVRYKEVFAGEIEFGNWARGTLGSLVSLQGLQPPRADAHCCQQRFTATTPSACGTQTEAVSELAGFVDQVITRWMLSVDSERDERYAKLHLDGFISAWVHRHSPHKVSIAQRLWGEGAVAERLDCSLPTKANRIQLPPVYAADRRVFSGISRFPHPCIPALLHSRLISPSSTLKNLLSRAARISQLNSTTPGVHSRTCRKLRFTGVAAASVLRDDEEPRSYCETQITPDAMWSSSGMQGRGKREISEKTLRAAASSSRENAGVTPAGNEPGSHWCEANIYDLSYAVPIKRYREECTLALPAREHFMPSRLLGYIDIRGDERGARQSATGREEGRNCISVAMDSICCTVFLLPADPSGKHTHILVLKSLVYLDIGGIFRLSRTKASEQIARRVAGWAPGWSSLQRRAGRQAGRHMTAASALMRQAGAAAGRQAGDQYSKHKQNRASGGRQEVAAMESERMPARNCVWVPW
ncbi:hypothetical protein PR048_010601 [Dryococelus australis]|uniref:Uncharacterized protein n=1 Tax=Dryococelus australis TaxID=614101 RepID=A0ABQ9I375_9NEOP|nr:hypothetical protein PR048_010601 [Dryococelus australis]